MKLITIAPDGAVRVDGVIAGSPADAAVNWPDLADEIATIAAEWQLEHSREIPALVEPDGTITS